MSLYDYRLMKSTPDKYVVEVGTTLARTMHATILHVGYNDDDHLWHAAAYLLTVTADTPTAAIEDWIDQASQTDWFLPNNVRFR